MNTLPIAEVMLDHLDAHAGFDHLADAIPVLEAAFDRWMERGAAANFPLIVAAATPLDALVLHAPGWPDADGACTEDLARRAVLVAIESEHTARTTDIITAGLSLLLGCDGRARQGRDAAGIREAGSVPLVVALLAAAGDETEALVATIAVVPRVLH